MSTPGVADRSKAVEAMLADSQPVRDIVAGGRHMRAKGEVYLPKFPLETQDDYDARLASTWLFNGVKKSRDDIVGRVFEKPVVLKEQEGQLFDWVQNIDLEGRDLSNFAKDVFQAALETGISFIMADAPPRSGELTRGQVEQMGWRPYLVGLKLEQVLGWQWQLIGGTPVLTQFRIKEAIADPDRSEFSDDTIEQIRVLTLDEGRVRVDLYRTAKEGGAWGLQESYETDFEQIYVVPVYTGREGFFAASPPLSEIAELNLAHWRVQSDKSSCLHKSLSPLLFLKQMTEITESGEAVVNSSGYGFSASSENADMKWVEITGNGLEAGERELDEIKSQMQQMGLQLISERVGVTTATGDSIQEGKSVSRIRMWADDLADSLQIALDWLVDIAGITADTTVVVNKEFGLLGSMPMTDIRDMYNAGVISRETYINEAKRRGVLDESVNPDDEVELVDGEGLDAER